MPVRRRIHTSIPVRSSLANAAFAVEERVVWGSADALRAVAEVVRWPFERVAWALERVLIWPLRERTGGWSERLRLVGAVALGLVAVGAGVLGFAWASGSGSKGAVDAAAPTPALAPVLQAPAPTEHLAQAAPVLHGAAPSFAETGGVAAGKTHSKATEGAGTSTSSSATTESSAASTSATAAKTAEVVPAGPVATKVARRFADAFVLFETGQNDAGVHSAFAATATPQLTRSLLHRPPRLPANVEVPQAKVLNVVPGPKHGDTYTLSISLLRVGITSELRIDMQRNEKSGEWQVTDVLG
jgi:hypothetical protein